jgi:hypothetical protein
MPTITMEIDLLSEAESIVQRHVNTMIAFHAALPPEHRVEWTVADSLRILLARAIREEGEYQKRKDDPRSQDEFPRPGVY